MNKLFYPKLAASGLKKNRRLYIPYLLTCIFTVAMFYIVKSLFLNPGLSDMIGDATMTFTMKFGCVVIGLFALIFLFYTNSFLMKQRKKEFGLFHILGMEKHHLYRLIAWENLYAAIFTLTAGLLFGIALDKAMFLLVSRMIGGEIPLGFFLSPRAVVETMVLFLGIYTLIFLNALRQIKTANPIELLHAGNMGEKEPKAKWFMAILGLLCTGAGYYLAITTENPVTSLFLVFVAVILVVIGTYLLFTAGSIALLKILKSHKGYYYKTRHFISVSGMIYRMKQNAVGLANICILSTGVLLMVACTTSLMVGMEDIIRSRYPNQLALYADDENLETAGEAVEAVKQLQKESGIEATQEMEYRYLAFGAILQEDTFLVTREIKLTEMDSVQSLMFVPLEDYNKAMGENKTLKPGEVLLYSNRTEYKHPRMKIFDRNYVIKERLKSFPGNGIIAANIANTQFIVMPNMEDIQELYEKQKEILTDIAGNIRIYYGFDTNAKEKEQEEFQKAVYNLMAENGYYGTMESSVNARQSFMGIYGGLFFIGIFLGLLFVMATVLIIYYKQISEGYDDKERFAIMQKVGMSREEVKASIRSQVVTVFFLPLITAGIHVAAAFPMFNKILILMNMENTEMYAVCTGICFLVFAVMYVVIYSITARTYYRIVSAVKSR